MSDLYDDLMKADFSKLSSDEIDALLSSLTSEKEQRTAEANGLVPEYCPRCGSKNFKKNGTRGINQIQKYRCNDCQKSFSGGYQYSYLRNSKLSVAQWDALITGIIENLTVSALAERMGVAKSTACEHRLRIAKALWRHYTQRMLEEDVNGNLVYQFDGDVECDETFVRLSFKGYRVAEFFIKDLHRFPRHHRTRAEHWEWLKKNNLYDYVMQNGGETFFDQLLENAKTYYSGISAEQACIVTAVDEYRKLIIKVPNIGKIDEKGVRAVLEGRLDQNDHLITDKLSSYESFAKMDNIPHTGIDSRKHTKDGYNLGMVNGLHKKIENFMPTSSERHTSTKYLEITLALFTLEWEMRGFSLTERAEHLRNFIHEHYAELDESYEQIKKFKPEIDTKGFFDANKF